MSDMLDWAKSEVEIACKKNPNRKDGEFDYGYACYESALKAFESLCKDGYSGFSMKMTQAILVRLLDGKPLTAIEDIDDIWNLVSYPKYGPIVYQCKRMSSLFKNVYSDGTVKYNDIDRSYCVSIHNPNETYSLGLVSRIIDEMFPISMPYMPGKPIKVYCEDFLIHEKNKVFATVGVFDIRETENGKPETIVINRFFREPYDNEENNWIEISKEEYYDRKNRQIISR